MRLVELNLRTVLQVALNILHLIMVCFNSSFLRVQISVIIIILLHHSMNKNVCVLYCITDHNIVDVSNLLVD